MVKERDEKGLTNERNKNLKRKRNKRWNKEGNGEQVVAALTTAQFIAPLSHNILLFLQVCILK